MSAYSLIVSSPDGTVFSGEVTKLVLRGANGDLAILAGHIPFITSVVPCECRIELEDGTEKNGHTDGGLLTVSSNSVTLLSSSFKWN